MEVHVHGKSTDTREVNSKESFSNPSRLTDNTSLEFSSNDLETRFSKFLHIKDRKASSPHFRKSATFPSRDCGKSSEDGLFDVKGKPGDEITVEVSDANTGSTPVDQCISRSFSLPSPPKLVSAMKGSRKKQGKPSRKLSVTWDPDVYDPIPNAASHVPSNKNQHRSGGRKHGKSSYRSFAKPSRAGKGKDKKKQVRKNSGSNSKVKPLNCSIGMIGLSKYKTREDADEMIGFSEGLMPNTESDVEKAGTLCGSTFLVSKMHFSVLEGT